MYKSSRNQASGSSRARINSKAQKRKASSMPEDVIMPVTEEPEQKRTKKTAAPSDEVMLDLGKMKFVSVSVFRGQVLIDIRQYWLDSEGQPQPSKKGISLNTEQWRLLTDQISEINDQVIRLS